MSKGSKQRPTDLKQYRENYDRAFKKDVYYMCVECGAVGGCEKETGKFKRFTEKAGDCGICGKETERKK